MKKEIKQKIAIVVAIVGLMPLMLFGCDPDDDKEQPPLPQPVWQAKDITIAESKTVTVNYHALPGATPTWWTTLEDVFHDRAAGFGTFHYTLNVIYTGTEGFVAGGVGSGRTATVSNAFLSSSDYTTMRASMGPMVAMWVAMHSGNDVIRMVGATVLVHQIKHIYNKNYST